MLILRTDTYFTSFKGLDQISKSARQKEIRGKTEATVRGNEIAICI